jgi:CBS domain-containing protein
VQKFVDFWVVPDQQDYVVVSPSGTLAGIASVHDLRKLPKDEWESTPLEKLVEPHHAVAWPDEPLDDVLERMADNRLAVLPVVDPSTNEVISSITNSDLLTTIIEPQKPGPK